MLLVNPGLIFVILLVWLCPLTLNILMSAAADMMRWNVWKYSEFHIVYVYISYFFHWKHMHGYFCNASYFHKGPPPRGLWSEIPSCCHAVCYQKWRLWIRKFVCAQINKSLCLTLLTPSLLYCHLNSRQSSHPNEADRGKRNKITGVFICDCHLECK